MNRTFAVTCSPTDVTMEMYPSSDADPHIVVPADSSTGQHPLGGSGSAASPAVLSQIPVNQPVRASFDSYNDAGHTLDRSYFAYASGTGCEFEASASVG